MMDAPCIWRRMGIPWYRLPLAYAPDLSGLRYGRACPVESIGECKIPPCQWSGGNMEKIPIKDGVVAVVCQ